MLGPGISAFVSSRLTVAVMVSAGIHAAIFGAASLISTQTSTSAPAGGADSIRVELVAAAPASSPMAPPVKGAAAGSPRSRAVEPRDTPESTGNTTPAPSTEVANAPATTERESARETAGDTIDENVPVAEATAEPEVDAEFAATGGSAGEISPVAAPTTAVFDRTPRSIDAVATLQKPRPRTPITPTYPRRARRLGWEGIAVIRATVETDGSPTALAIVSSSGYELLNRAALEAVQSATFHPGIVGASQRRRMNVDLRIVFQLTQKESS